MPSKEATVIPNPKAAPSLTEGKITPAALTAWENGCERYFRDREVSEDKKVAKACMQISNELVLILKETWERGEEKHEVVVMMMM